MMERVKLSKREKNVMRLLRDNNANALSEFDTPSVERLATIGFIRHVTIEGGSIEDAKLTNMGKEYINCNPRLHNPIDWKWIVTTSLLSATAIAAVAALFISCTK